MILPLRLVCGHCGYQPAMAKLGLSSLAEVSADWWCQCGNHIYQFFPIEWLITHIPGVPFQFSPEDEKLLSEMHIKGETDDG
jgi:hypothetical protein